MTQQRKTVACWLAITITLLLLASPALSQDGGFGAIVEGNSFGAEGIGSLNPLRCDNSSCGRITGLLFPTLLGVDLEKGVFAPSSGNDSALAVDWDVSQDGMIYTFHLRDDLTWSDDVPVTAYDVFYSYLAIASYQIGSPLAESINETIGGAVPLDDYTIAFISESADCATLDNLNLPVIPAHVFEPDFAQTAAAAFNKTDDLEAQFARWAEEQWDHDFSFMVNHPFDFEPSVTAGVYRLDEMRPQEFIRLESLDGRQGFEYRDVPDSNTQVDRFLSGDLNFIANPPDDRRQDIREAEDVQVFEYPGTIWYYIGFNLADPGEPLSAFDDDGNLVEQPPHPLFGDVRVRRAIQMAIDVNALIEASVFGAGTVMAADQLPGSWAYDPNLAPIPYDPVGAASLLDEAGWRDWTRDGNRECHGCLYAEEGAPFSFGLSFNGDSLRYSAMASLIEQQLGEIGVSVFRVPTSSSAFYEATFQHYDAYLAGWGATYPIDPDHTRLFTRANDVLGEGWNTTSYYNPVVEDLMAEARAVPGCDVSARAEIYREIQAILQEDQPYVWLFAPHDMVAARGSVVGFDPYPNMPLWNIRDWVIVE